ncbi:chitin deacetylase 2 precursor [Spathaspora passalidarum NRRL Y-27907]|uniref:chitin deacetylase n=1 Tax=Spathaspora passalidarum (strain NRRL Y-27907 / 11-Y1) TaxID=619300 RepID=G3AJC3_SPAPN|nr:chitin deacetylase 2 precursor [Spathaspora passalidarum NRRL Y-27907]EGW34582.1 chitin deacetylase 2 precursor [Spathaspora passalidarum NRRL Y-27907]
MNILWILFIAAVICVTGDRQGFPRLSSKFSRSPSSKNHETDIIPKPINRLVPIKSNPILPFPKWLTDFTGLKEWPGLDPPYIPLDFIDFNKIIDTPRHQQAQCSNPMLRTPTACSFDCFNCVDFDDVYTCPKLSQTFDDGPSPYTLKLLDSFNATNTKTTLFTLGINIVRHPDVYRQSHARGHIMGSHTWSHQFLPGLSNQQIIAQIQWSIWAMNATAGHLPKWFRPPYGGIDNRVRSILRQFGMQAVLWDFDTFDWKMLDSTNNRKEQDVYNDVKRFQVRNQAKGIMLEHDAILKTVNVGIEINKNILKEQLTIPECVGGINYIKTFQ